MAAMNLFKLALLEAAALKEKRVKEWIDAKKATYSTEEAFFADLFALVGVNEVTKLREACDEVGSKHKLSDADKTMLFVCLHGAWNETIDWAHAD